MVIAPPKVSAQGQISLPAKVRRRLGIGPGSILEWDEEDEALSCAAEAGLLLKTSTAPCLAGTHQKLELSHG